MPASLRNNKRAKVQRLVIAQPFSPLSEHRHLSALSTSLQSVFFSTVILTGGKKNLSADCHRVFPLPFLFHLVFFFRNRFDLQRKYISDENPCPWNGQVVSKSLFIHTWFFFSTSPFRIVFSDECSEIFVFGLSTSGALSFWRWLRGFFTMKDFSKV